MGYAVFQNGKEYGSRKGLEGPFNYPNGRVLYYDAAEGKYYDPLTDWYLERDEIDMLNQQMIDVLSSQP